MNREQWKNALNTPGAYPYKMYSVPFVEGTLLDELERLQRIESAARAHIAEWDGGDTSAHETRAKLRAALGEVQK